MNSCSLSKQNKTTRVIQCLHLILFLRFLSFFLNSSLNSFFLSLHVSFFPRLSLLPRVLETHICLIAVYLYSLSIPDFSLSLLLSACHGLVFPAPVSFNCQVCVSMSLLSLSSSLARVASVSFALPFLSMSLSV